jgi:hypothetical protein
VTQDDTRVNFLLALDRSDAVELKGFEAEFVESNLAAFSFSPKQRVIIDKLIVKYEDTINWNPNRNRLAERAAEEQKAWDAQPARYMARAGQPPLRSVAHAKEKLKRGADRRWQLEHSPIVVGTVRRDGMKLEPWFIDHKAGVLKEAPFLKAGDDVEYDYYTR